MGYTTDFFGHFTIDRPLDDETFALLRGLAQTRRMKRAGLDPKYGIDGEFYFDPSSTEYGQERDASIVDFNTPPETQPSLWCHWTPTDDRNEIVWDEGEKFYEYVAWIEYLICAILAPRGYMLNGEVEWQGEDSDDFGKICIENNMVSEKIGRKVFDF